MWPSVALDHAGEEGLDRPEVGERVDRHRLLDPLVGRIEELLARDDARVVDEEPDRPEALGALLGPRVDLGAVGNVAAKAADIELPLRGLGLEPSRAASSRSQATTLAPRSARPSARRRPMPLAPPVMTAVLPSIDFMAKV